MSDTPNPIQATTSSPVAPSTGGLLRAARERAGMAVEDIASKLKLSARQITAIENEDWDSLPEAPFTRGFVRSYARLVGVDPDSLRLNTARPMAETVLAPTPVGIGEVTRDSDGNGRGWSGWVIPAVLVALLAAGVAWFLWRGTPMPASGSKLPVEAVKQQAQVDSAAAAAATQAPTSVLTLPPSPAATNADSATSTPANAPAVVSGGAFAGFAAPTAASPATAGATPSGVTATTPPAAVTSKKQVTLSFSGRSWTEVRSNGELVFTETVSSGSREVSAALPLSFVIGGATNVTMKIDGKPYDFSGSIRNDVARFRIE